MHAQLLTARGPNSANSNVPPPRRTVSALARQLKLLLDIQQQNFVIVACIWVRVDTRRFLCNIDVSVHCTIRHEETNPYSLLPGLACGRGSRACSLGKGQSRRGAGSRPTL